MEQNMNQMTQAELIVIINALSAAFSDASAQRNELEEQLSTAQENTKWEFEEANKFCHRLDKVTQELERVRRECEGLRLANAMLKIQNSEHIKSNRALSNRLYTNGGLHAQA